jgi:ubiquinone/menaquinone biosynthesis C-methylase UbiE
MRSDTQKHFDSVARAYYERNYEQPRTRHERALALRRISCLDLVRSVRGRVLDLGCGPGALAVPLAMEGREVVAFDLSTEMVQVAKSLIGDLPNTSFCVGDAVSLPFAAGAFDVVVTTGVLEYVPSIERALAEIARVLRPGGSIVATVSLPRTLERQVTRLVGPWLVHLKGGTASSSMFHRAYDVNEIEKLLGIAGFEILDRRFSCFAPFPVDAICPPLVTLIDEKFGAWLAKSKLATSRAKTYIVKAVRT